MQLIFDKDENVMSLTSQLFYAPLNASYSTKSQITKIINILQTMSAHLIQSQTIDVSVSNLLSLMLSLKVYN